MTDKIIIDGVNIKECPHRNLDCSTFMNIIKCYNYGTCEGQNCLWKQHERLKEENENLKQQLEIDKNQINYFIEKNEKLKTQYNCYACSGCKGKEDYINLEKHHKGLRKQFDKYHNALQDIKTLVTTDYIQNKRQLVQNYDCLDNFMQKIEEKCSEIID